MFSPDRVEEPILKKKIKKSQEPKQIISDLKFKKNKTEFEENENDTNYDKFLKMYKIKKSNNLLKNNAKTNIYKLSSNEIESIKKPKINFQQKKNYNNYKTHFDKSHLEFSEKYYEIIKDKDIPKLYQKEDLLKNFEFQDTKQLKTENDILNNSVKIREFSLKRELKNSKVEKSSKCFDSLILDKNSNEFIEQEGICSDLILHKKIRFLLEKEEFDDSDKELFNFLSEYIDLIYLGYEENEFLKFRRVWILHVLNHLLKTVKMTEKENEIPIREKGYTKCKTLILTPYKRDAYEIIMDIIEYYNKGNMKKTSHKSRFLKEFGTEDIEIQDDFKIGISFAGKSINLYTAFGNSDLIIASPLGLRLVTGSKGDPNRDFSFLSSIEILVIDQAQTLYMQNWQNVEEIIEIINKIPKYKDMSNGLDEIREYYFENMSKFYRQNIVYSEYNFPELNSIKNRFFENYKGSIQNKLKYSPLFNENMNNFTSEFLKLEINKFEDDFDKRFEFFKNKIWLKINDSSEMFKTVIFVNSYYEFVKLRNYFKKTNSFVQFISEYTPKPKVQSKLSKFNKNTVPFLLFSERAFFFNICQLKKINHIIFYSIPKNSEIFKKMIFSLTDPSDEENQAKGPSYKNKVKTIFNKYDAIFLEKIVGTENVSEFLAEYNRASTFII